MGRGRPARFSGKGWLTFRQALSLGGDVRKGERRTTVVYVDRFTPEDEKRRARETGEDPGKTPFLKRFTLFNTAQCEGLPEEIAISMPPPGLIEQRVEALIKATGINFRIGGDRAFYIPSLDHVVVPPPQAHFESINWHRTALHELGNIASVLFANVSARLVAASVRQAIGDVLETSRDRPRYVPGTVTHRP